jgi:acetyl esterase/lipase
MRRKSHLNRALLIPFLVLLVGIGLGCATRGGVGSNDATSTDQIKVVKDLVYYQGKAFDKDSHILDLYLPKGKTNFPVLFFVHGGGYFGGDKSDAANVGMAMAGSGIGVVSINYRLYPKAGHPGIIYDVARAFSWTVKNIAKYGGDKRSIFTAGHSAGGHLATIIATNKRFLKRHDLTLRSIRGAIGIDGVYRMTKTRVRRIFAENEEVRKDSSPIYNVSSSTPVHLILFAENEFEDLGKQARDYAAEIKKHDRPVRLVKADGRNHGTLMSKIGSRGDEATKEIKAFITKYKR